MEQKTVLPKDEGVQFIQVTKAEALAAHALNLSLAQSFFEWWKRGVELAGYQYFGDGTKQGFNNAKGKSDLRPLPDKIEQSIGLVSDSEMAFLTGMYCFYNDYRGAELCAKAGNKSIGNIMILDSARREVVAGLLITYCGW